MGKKYYLKKSGKYSLNWYHTHLLLPGLYITNETIHKCLYCPGIIKSVRKEVKDCGR